ncbi:ATP-binding cassette domain-containing protein, partial [Corynebacterium variabile]
MSAIEVSDLSVHYGQVNGLIGTNGSGKSTLFNTLMGEITPTRGTVEVADRAGHLVSYVPQAEAVDWTFPLTVGEVVMTGRYGHMGFL